MTDLGEARTARPGELAQVAELHCAIFPDYQSSRAGRGYCRRMLTAYAAHAQSWVSVALRNGEIIGYLVAAPPAVQRACNRDLAPWAAVGLLRSPRFLASQLPALVRRARRRSSGSPSSGADAPLRAGEEISVAGGQPATIRVVLVGVSSASRGSGAADLLLQHFAGTARVEGHAVADLSVAASNAAARRAYQRNGWREVALEGDDVAVRCQLDLTAAGDH